MKTEKIKYVMGKLIAEGALVYDDAVSGKRPAVLRVSWRSTPRGVSMH